MTRRRFATITSICTTALALYISASSAAGAEQTAPAPLTLVSARVSIAGTSNIHDYTATTTAVRVTRVQLAASVTGDGLWEEIVKPGAIEAFDVAIAAATLSSPKDGLDKNMHKALKVTEHPEIVFRLRRIEAGTDAPGALRGVGMLQIAGVEKEVAIALTTVRDASTLTVQGTLRLLMTDYGIKPPVAMLGMLKTGPTVTVTFETVLGIPLT